MQFYNSLFSALGPQHWWPGRTPFEVIVGAILTQSTAWTNVERAIANLRRERLLTPRALERVPLPRLARLVRPSGYFRQKAKKLKAFVSFLRQEYGGSLARMFRTPTAELRSKLLAVHGIGPETADSILLYAAGHRVFVVDAYTKRILLRHGFIAEKASYEDMRGLFERSLPHDVPLYNEYHALLVHVGKEFCRPREARCAHCPLEPFLPAQNHAPGHASKLTRSSRQGVAFQASEEVALPVIPSEARDLHSAPSKKTADSSSPLATGNDIARDLPASCPTVPLDTDNGSGALTLEGDTLVASPPKGRP